jgi:hypothetical protein
MGKGKTKRRSTPAKPDQQTQGKQSGQGDPSVVGDGATERSTIATQNEAILTSKNFRLAKELVSFRIPEFVFSYSNRLFRRTRLSRYSLKMFDLPLTFFKQNEMRVKLRDETKIVRQLTMDNVSSHNFSFASFFRKKRFSRTSKRIQF